MLVICGGEGVGNNLGGVVIKCFFWVGWPKIYGGGVAKYFGGGKKNYDGQGIAEGNEK